MSNTFKVGGRLHPEPEILAARKHLCFKKYTQNTKSSLPIAPPFGDFWSKAAPSFKQIYLNNILQDCIIAAGNHLLGLWLGNANKPLYIASDDEIISDYAAICGYVRGEPYTDRGGKIYKALQYWSEVGFGDPDRTKIAGYISIDGTNPTEVLSALNLFEGIMIGMDLPNEWVDPCPRKDGFVWDVAGDPNLHHGHCVLACGWNPNAICISTWGLLGWMPWDSVVKYCAEGKAGGEMYIALSEAMIIAGEAKCPNGFDWATLKQDFNDMNSVLDGVAGAGNIEPLI